MSRLVAFDIDPTRARPATTRAEWPLVLGNQHRLGRNVAADQLHTPWDEEIADFHATVQCDGIRVHVYGSEDNGARLPIYYGGELAAEFSLVPGEGFVIGRTAFQFDPARSLPTSDRRSPPLIHDPAYLRTQLPTDTETLQDIVKLLRIPDNLGIDQHQDVMVQTLRSFVPAADLVAIVCVKEEGIETLAKAGDLEISEPFARGAVRTQHSAEVGWLPAQNHRFPAMPDAKWAYCVPVLCETRNYAIYLSGKGVPRATESGSALRVEQQAFVQIVADVLQSSRTLTDLSRCRSELEVFFPKQIRNLLRRDGPKHTFRTDEARAAILFCDLRGSSRFAEQRANRLMDAWDGIKQALKIMTVAITGQHGCIGDFQGDAAMAFWGWPRRTGAGDTLPEDVTCACHAADNIREQFDQVRGQLGLACGIGIAAGPVVAGMLGTEEQRKIDVFGPAVNLAARLESMTKLLGVSIVIDETARMALLQEKGHRAAELAERLRFLGVFQPAGMDVAVRVYELMPPPADSRLTRNLQALFDDGRRAFEEKDWDTARRALRRVADAGDGPSSFLLNQMDAMRSPPPGWDGRIVLAGK